METELKARPLSISTSTITSFINKEVNLSLISRFVNIYNYHNKQLNTKEGGIFHQSYFNDFPRTNLEPVLNKQLKLHKKKCKEFNNQTTIHYKYYESFRVNIKLFSNGRLELTGIKTEQETEFVSNLLISTLKNISIPIYYEVEPSFVEDKNQPQVPLSHHYFLLYNSSNGKYSYSRYINGKIYTADEIETNIKTRQTEITAMKKNIKTIVDNINWELINYIEWNHTISHMTKVKELIKSVVNQINKILIENRVDINYTGNCSNYLEFRELFTSELNQQLKTYFELVVNQLQKQIRVLRDDVAIVELFNKSQHITSKLTTPQQIYHFNIGEVVQLPGEYLTTHIETHLINSDYNVNFYINLDELVRVLTNYGMFNYYNPNSYPGILAKFYYNIANPIQGICNCEKHCSTKEKKSICTKITISIFRPGSIIITGSKSIQQLVDTYEAINKILFANYGKIKGTVLEEDIKQNSFKNNELRKLGKKNKIFYFPKSSLLL